MDRTNQLCSFSSSSGNAFASKGKGKGTENRRAGAPTRRPQGCVKFGGKTQSVHIDIEKFKSSNFSKTSALGLPGPNLKWPHLWCPQLLNTDLPFRLNRFSRGLSAHQKISPSHDVTAKIAAIQMLLKRCGADLGSVRCDWCSIWRW